MRIIIAMSTLVIAGAASALDVDGTITAAEYGDASSLQNTSTNFGNNTDPLTSYANGSELDVAYTTVSQGVLYIGLVGSLESNWNKLDLFIDCRDGGQHRILGINPDIDFSALQRMGDDGSGNGLTFEADFDADYWVSVTCGDWKGMGIQYHGSAAELKTNGDGAGYNLGMGTTTDDGSSTVVTPIVSDSGIEIAINNAAIGGVNGGTGLDCGETADTTGIEIGIPLWVFDWDFEGIPFDSIRIVALISSSDHSYVSNQVLGGIGGGDNLGEVRSIDFGAIAGDQLFQVGVGAAPCPEFFLGACCFANGECWESLQAEDCDNARGLWMGEDTTCDDCDLGGGTDTCPTDTDGNGVVDVNDLLNVIATFNQVCP
jgi:hypothetical protein